MDKLMWINLVAGILIGVVQLPLASGAEPRVIEIVVKNGYQPEEIPIQVGERVRLRFIRQGKSGCTREVVFPSLGIRKELPTGEPVDIDLGPLPAGEVTFHCGMNMVHGSIIVKPN